jgi:hypothetical protein
MNKMIRPIILSGLLILTLLSCSTSKTASHKINKESIYRDYVLYKCLVLGYGVNADFSKDITPAIYNDFVDYTLGNTPIGRKLDSLANKEISSIKPSEIVDHGGEKAIFMNCLNYYNSNELKIEIKKLIKEFKEQQRKQLLN